MKHLSICFLLIFSMALAQAEPSPRYHPHHLFVKMNSGEKLLKSSLMKSSKRIFGDLYLIKTTDAQKLSEEISSNPSVEYTQKDFYSEKRAMPKHEVLDNAGMFLKGLQNFDFFSFNDPEVNKLWAFNGSNGMDVAATYASLPRWTPKEVIVAVVDTGVDHTHEDLKDVMWINHGEIPGDGIDNDGNGYIDDIHGINTLVRDSRGRATMNTMASHWHGTHVAGTIAATQNNGVGIAGVANNVKIMAIRTVPDAADELDSDIVEAFLYAARNGAKVINCSFGKKDNEGGMVVRDTINEIGKKGVLVIAAAGNDSSPFRWHNNDVSPKYPASFDSPNLLTVASTASTGSLSSFTNIGKNTVHLAAPGSNIYSTLNKNKYGMASGTSMAAPNAAGVAAMIMGYFPGLKAVSVKEAMMSSVTPVSSYADKMVSGGRVNLKNALIKAHRIRRQ